MMHLAGSFFYKLPGWFIFFMFNCSVDFFTFFVHNYRSHTVMRRCQ